MLVEQVTKEADAGLTGMVVEGLAKRVRVDDVPLVGLIDRPLDRDRPGDGGEVEEGADQSEQLSASDYPAVQRAPTPGG